MNIKVTACVICLLSFSSGAFGAEQSVQLSVPGMFCASCPFIVQAAIEKVEGVRSVKTDLKTRTAVVVFDDDLTTTDSITSATRDAGYESSIVDGGNNS